jgi:3-oxoacyl-[acyl-carrier-protein] synthase III
MKAFVRAIEYYLPEMVLSNEQLSAEFPGWSVEKIEDKTGISERRISAQDEFASDLGVSAVQRLFVSGACRPSEIDFLLFCTQSPDFYLPTTACIMQERLAIPTTAGALDFNLGCSGYIYGLGLAKGLIETDQAQNVLLVTAETYSKFIYPEDRSVRTLFGDGAAATLIQGMESPVDCLGPFVYGTDGKGAQNLIVPSGGLRQPIRGASPEVIEDESGNRRTSDSLHMNGAEIFSFTLQTVPEVIHQALERASCSLEDVDLFVFHQANRYMLDHLRRKLKIPPEKFVFALEKVGNTVSSTIPIALKQAQEQGDLYKGQKILLVGFGVGYSWGSAFIRWEI